MDDLVTPAARTLISQMESVSFQRGLEEGRWIVQRFEFPNLFVRVIAMDPETGARAQTDFHLLCDDFPMPGPFVERWDFGSNCRPAPPSVGAASPAFCDALKEWSEHAGQHGGIYRAWQRIAAAHNGWAQLRPDEAWHAKRHISFIMERLYDLVSEQAVWIGVRKAA